MNYNTTNLFYIKKEKSKHFVFAKFTFDKGTFFLQVTFVLC